MWEVVAVATVGLVATLTAPLLAAWRASRNDHLRRLFEERVLLYVELNRVAIREGRFLDYLSDYYHHEKSDDKIAGSLDVLTARVELLAQDDVRVAWKTLIRSRYALHFEIEQSAVHILIPEIRRPGDELDVTNEFFMAYKNSVENLLRETRRVSM